MENAVLHRRGRGGDDDRTALRACRVASCSSPLHGGRVEKPSGQRARRAIGDHRRATRALPVGTVEAVRQLHLGGHKSA